MNTNNTRHKRKIHFIDPAVQNRLLISFVLLEVILTVAGMLVLYLHLKEIADENLFRIHFASREPLSELLRQGMRILGGLVVLNVAALGLAEWLWFRHLNSILLPLSGFLDRTGKLDFSHDEKPRSWHNVLARAEAWREAERKRCKSIRAEISALDEHADYSSAGILKQTRTTLENLKALLPVHHSASQDHPSK